MKNQGGYLNSLEPEDTSLCPLQRRRGVGGTSACPLQRRRRVGGTSACPLQRRRGVGGTSACPLRRRYHTYLLIAFFKRVCVYRLDNLNQLID